MSRVLFWISLILLATATPLPDDADLDPSVDFASGESTASSVKLKPHRPLPAKPMDDDEEDNE
jgi:hypothetical protein